MRSGNLIIKLTPCLSSGLSVILFFYLIVNCTRSLAQTDASGTWRGVIQQSHGRRPVTFQVALTINKDYQGEVIGTVNYVKSDGATASEHFDGFMSGKNVTLTEKEVRSCVPINSVWPLKLMHLTFVHNEQTGIDSLTGPWEGVRIYDHQFYFEIGVKDDKGVIHKCEPGYVHLYRNPPPADAKLPIQQVTTVNTPPTKPDSTVKTFVLPPVAKAIAVAPPVIKRVIVKSNRPLDGYYEKTQVKESTPMKYAPLGEADIGLSRRIWREIDLREKMNQYLASPKARLADVLLDAVKAGDLTAYSTLPTKDDPDGDGFSQPLTPEKAMSLLADSSLVTKRDADNNILKSYFVAGTIDPDSIVRFRIKEDWIFDRQRSVYEPRIIGIAPMIRLKVGGIATDMQPAFWIYFPQARPLLAAKAVANGNNDATGLSFDDIFLKRLFTAYIVKESNNKDERIKDYAIGIDRLYEAQRINKTMMDWELDLWQY
jgi:gliding motility associated protien GldN